MQRNAEGWALLAPAIIILVLVGLTPFVYVLIVSFFDWNVFAATAGLRWTAGDNFRKLVHDDQFLRSVGRGVIFTLSTVGLSMLLGLFLAQLLHKELPGKQVFRTIHALPLTIAPIALGAVWRLMTLPGFGIVPFWFRRMGIDYNISKFAGQAFMTTVFMDVWHWTPLVTLIILAGLQAMPRSPIESAQVDGATGIQTYWHITLPLLRPVILTALFIRIMDAFRIVDEVWMLTGGGPGTATRYVGIHIWRVVFPKTDYGYGSAISVFVLYITIVLCWLLMTFIMQSRTRVRQ